MANFRGEGGVDVTDEMLDKWENDAEKAYIMEKLVIYVLKSRLADRLFMKKLCCL